MADSRAAPNWRRLAGFAGLVAFVAVVTITAMLMMFSRFMLYDDEGYVLLSLRNFAEHGRLYGDVYTQYGPLPFVAYYVLHLIGVPLTHTAGRLVTLATWSGAALFSATMVWRATRSYTLIAAVVAAVFVYLWVMVSEPTHPGGLIVVLTAAIAAGGAHRLRLKRENAWAVIAGAGVAALLLTKINVGVFAAVSTGAFVLFHSRSTVLQRWSPWIVSAGFAVLPFALMRPLLNSPWVQTYAIIYSVSAAIASGAIAVGRAPRLGGRELKTLILSGCVVAIVVVGMVLARGTTPAELLQGVLLGPLRHPVSFSLAFKWAPGAIFVTLASGGIFLGALALRRNGRGITADTTVALLRLIVGVGLALTIARFPAVSADNIVLAYGLSCLWLFLWPLSGENDVIATPRTWVGLLLLGQFLHPFPVPGSQIAWGTFLILPLGAIGAWQAAIWLAGRFHSGSSSLSSWSIAPRIALIAFAGYVGWGFSQIGRQYFEGRTLALPGAEQIRLPDESTARYQLLSFNALAHADLLFSLPGMFSFNLWTRLPTPTLANVTHWFSLLTAAQQQEIIHALDSHPHAVVIVETGHVAFLRSRGLAPAGPLYDYIEHTFVPAFTVDGFEFRVRQGRRIAPFFTAEVYQRPIDASVNNPGAAMEKTQILLPLSLPSDASITSVEIVSLRGFAAPLILTGRNARVEATPITLQGDPRGPTEVRTLPLTLTGPSSVALFFDGGNRPFDLKDTLIVLRNAAGAELGLVRLRP